MRILLAVDKSSYAETTAASIAGRAWPPGTAVDVVTVVEPYSEPVLPGPNQAFVVHQRIAYEEERSSALSLVERIAGRLQECLAISGVAAHVLTGNPADSIVSAAGDFGSDLVVVGAQGRGEVSRFFLGSVSEKVLLHCPCSVEIVKKEVSLDSFHLLVPVDFSAPSEAALSVVAELPWRQPAAVKLLTVLPSPTQEIAGFEMSGVSAARLIADAEEYRIQARSQLGKKAEALQEKLALEDVSWQVAEGDAREVIIDTAASWPASLIVMGSRGRTGLARFFLGSVAEAVVRHAPFPCVS